MTEIKAPVGGKILKTLIDDGSTVSKGDVLFIVEAMKMELEVKSSEKGTVRYIKTSGEIENGEVIAKIFDESEVKKNGITPTTMTREEFIKKYEKYPDYEKLLNLFDTKSAEYSKLVEEHRKAGDLIQFWQNEKDNSPDNNFLISLFVTEQEAKLYIDVLVQEHKSKGDYENWISSLKENDFIRYAFIVVNEQRKNKTLEAFLKNLLKDDKKVFYRICTESLKKDEITEIVVPIYQPVLEEHRKIGDLVDFIWDEFETYELGFDEVFAKASDKYSQSTINDSLSKKRTFQYFVFKKNVTNDELEELNAIATIIFTINNSDEKYFVNGNLSDFRFKYLYSLSQFKEGTPEFRRYRKIKKYFKKDSTLEKLEESITITISKQRFKKILFIGIPIFIVVLAICVLFAL